MARQESPREDLIRDARALVRRVQLTFPDEPGTNLVVIGVRKTGDVSLYFGEDPALHFNQAGQLRRAYLDGRLLKADGHRLVSMHRHRTSSEVQLISRMLGDEEAALLLNHWAGMIESLLNSLHDQSATITRTGDDMLIDRDEVIAWLETIPRSPIVVAECPNVG